MIITSQPKERAKGCSVVRLALQRWTELKALKLEVAPYLPN